MPASDAPSLHENSWPLSDTPLAVGLDAVVIAGFVDPAYQVAMVIDPILATMLKRVLESAQCKAVFKERHWSAGRAAGLEFCRRLLSYVHLDLRNGSLRPSLDYIDCELGILRDSVEERLSH